MEALAEIISDFFNSIGQSRSFGDVASMSELPSKTVVERTSVHGSKVPLTDSCTAKKRTTIQAHRRVGGATAPSDPRPNPFAPCERTDYMPWRPALLHRSNVNRS